MRPTRRAFLTAGFGTLLCGCTSGASSPARRNPPSSPPATVGTTPSVAAPTLPAVRRWQPAANDLEPLCKLAAVRRIEAAWSGPDRVLEVVDAQYGGLLADAASVLVVTRSWTRTGRVVSTGGRTYDVRLTRRGGRWRVGAVHPSHPGLPGPLTAAARRVLADDRIDLPPAARRDVLSGQVHDAPLLSLLALARDFRVGVSVLRSGHPLHVFGTDRLSDHPQGRAFDTWRVDRHAVVDARTSRRLVTEYMHAVAATGSDNVGGPYLLGSAPQWFSDATHHDHVHAGFAT